MQCYRLYLILSILAIVSLSASSKEKRLRGEPNAENHYQRRLVNAAAVGDFMFDGITTGLKSGAGDVGDDILKNAGTKGVKEGLEGAGHSVSKNADALGGGHNFGNMPQPHGTPHGTPHYSNAYPSPHGQPHGQPPHANGYPPPSGVAMPYAAYPPHNKFHMTKRHKLGVAALGAGAMYLGSEMGESNAKYKHTLGTLEEMQEEQQEEEDEELEEEKKRKAEQKAKEARQKYREQQEQQLPEGYGTGQGYYQGQTPGGGNQYQQQGEKPKYVVYTGPNGEPEVYYA